MKFYLKSSQLSVDVNISHGQSSKLIATAQSQRRECSLYYQVFGLSLTLYIAHIQCHVFGGDAQFLSQEKECYR